MCQHVSRRQKPLQSMDSYGILFSSGRQIFPYAHWRKKDGSNLARTTCTSEPRTVLDPAFLREPWLSSSLSVNRRKHFQTRAASTCFNSPMDTVAVIVL